MLQLRSLLTDVVVQFDLICFQFWKILKEKISFDLDEESKSEIYAKIQKVISEVCSFSERRHECCVELFSECLVIFSTWCQYRTSNSKSSCLMSLSDQASYSYQCTYRFVRERQRHTRSARSFLLQVRTSQSRTDLFYHFSCIVISLIT